MNKVLTRGIILSRTDYGEADRILTILTPDHGKLRLIAKGVRKSTSKLAGGIELFCVSELSYIPGKGEIGTLVSTRLIKYFDTIVRNLDRTMLGYELIKQLHRITEDAVDEEYYDLLVSAFAGLDDKSISVELLTAWFEARLLRLGGNQPNLRTDATGNKLEADRLYMLEEDGTTFTPHDNGVYTGDHIKVLRLLFGIDDPRILGQVKDMQATFPLCQQLVRGLYAHFFRY